MSLFTLTTIIENVTVTIEVFAHGLKAYYIVNQVNYTLDEIMSIHFLLESVKNHIEGLTRPIVTDTLTFNLKD